MTADFIAQLHCPYCGSGFHARSMQETAAGGMRYGTLTCACYRYPVIDGIPILKQRSAAASTFDGGVALVEKGDFDGALRDAFRSSPMAATAPRWARTAGRLRRAARRFGWARGEAPLFGPSVTLRQALELTRPPGYAHYLFHRHANTSFLAAIPILLLLRELHGGAGTGRVLDLNCGVGHASFLIGALFPQLSVTATDHDFVNLYLARRYIAPAASLVVVDTELPLPFADSLFDAVLCLDGLHYVRAKRALLAELDRTVDRSGLWLFPHLHNAVSNNVAAGIPLAPADYARLFAFLPSRMRQESDVLRDFVADQTVDLEHSAPAATLQHAQVLTLVASRRPDVWRVHEGLGETLARCGAGVGVNPIYRPHVTAASRLELTMNWPSRSLESECREVKDFLPASWSIDSGVLRRLREGALTAGDRHVVESLMRSLLLVHLPSGYAQEMHA